MIRTLSLRALLVWPLAIALAIAFVIATSQTANAQIPTECPPDFPLCPTEPPSEPPAPGEEESPAPEESPTPEPTFDPQVQETPEGGVAAGPTAPQQPNVAPLLILTAAMTAAGAAGYAARRRALREDG